jgi:hypothetical protein
VQLVARGPVERPPAVRADLALDAEIAQKRERAAGDGWRGDVEVEGELAVTPEMEAAGGMEERRDLGERVAAALGAD